ncbi:MAG: hypothetical protein FJ318_08605 [SAR202 cluster bacterium]|nr:hypothetical protein [SAR202 cluster bacterium]
MSKQQPHPEPHVREAIAALSRMLCAEHRIEPEPRIEWSTRMRNMLGKAYGRENLIRLSAWLNEEQSADTLRHELAHIAVWHEEHQARRDARVASRMPGAPANVHVVDVRAHGRFDDAPHGDNWKRWAERLGAVPKATSKAPPLLAPQREPKGMRHGLECPNCGMRLVRARLARGLYHTACGPQRGMLRRVLHDTAANVIAWVSHGGEQLRLFRG